MSVLMLAWALALAQVMLGLSMLCVMYRIVSGPRAQDRVLALDSLYVIAMLTLLVFGIQTGRTLYFEAALIIALLVVAGAAVTLIGSIGLLRFKTFYDRLHPPTLGSSLGSLLIVAGSIVCFSVLRSRLSVHEILIALFVTLTTPVTFMLLARAALYRDRVEGSENVPQFSGEDAVLTDAQETAARSSD